MTYDTTSETTDTLETWNGNEHDVTFTTRGNHAYFTTQFCHTALTEEPHRLSFEVYTNHRLDNTDTKFTTGTVHIEVLDDTDTILAEETTPIEDLNHAVQPGYAFIPAIELNEPTPFDTIHTINIDVDPDPNATPEDDQSVPSTEFSIDISRPEDRNGDITATVHYPNDVSKTVTASQYAADSLMDSLDTLVAAYESDDPDALDDTICTNLERRAQLAMDALTEYDGCLETRYWEHDKELLAFLSITSTEPIEQLEFMCTMTPRYTSIDFNREHGLHLRVHWRVHDHGINYEGMDEFDRDEFTQRYADKSLSTWETIDAVLAKRDEHLNATDAVITNETVSDGPRIAGTDNHALHIAWLLRERDETRDDFDGTAFEELTDEDIDTALEYANEHPDEYDAYTAQKRDFHESLENSDSKFVPLDPDDSLEELPDEDEFNNEFDE